MIAEQPSKDIQNTINYGARHNEEITRSNLNESLFHGTYAILYLRKADIKIHLADLNRCLQKINEEINSHNDSCYTMPYEGYADYESANQTFSTSTTEMQIRDAEMYGSTDLERINEELTYVQNSKDGEINNANFNCGNALRLISNSLEFQKPYCERKRITINIINWLLVVIALGVGISLGKFGRRWDEK